MKDSFKKILLFSLAFFPMLVFASDGDEIIGAIVMEAFVSIHMSIFVLQPLSEIISKDNSKKVFWILFAIRVAILLFFDFFVTPAIMIFDFISIFIGAIIMNIIYPIKNKNNQPSSKNITSNPLEIVGYKCSKCGAKIEPTDKVCRACGEALDINYIPNDPNKVIVSPSNFDYMYNLDEEYMLVEYINRELKKTSIDLTNKMIPSNILKRKNVFNIIFSILVLVFISSIFFHFPIITYIIALIILVVFFIATRSYNLIKYLKKQIKARPNEKISNIVMQVTNSFVNDTSKGLFAICLVIAVILPLVTFYKPRIIYEKVDGGYAVRYYLFGINNYKTATIPQTHKNEKVVSLRGNTFSNMPFLKSVSLPNTIKEIRGQAFKNCISLVDINIPSNLEYLGGGSFYNAASIKRIELPDTLTYLGGESFYGADSLEYIKLSENLTEIRGDSFEYCSSLKSIIIPDKVTRIGGHAFYGDYSLSEVIITENSNLAEIGSSAFRQCDSLYNITIPYNTIVNERSFKESPTIVNRYEPK